MFLNFHLIKINADQNTEFMFGHSVKASSWEQNKVEMLLMSKSDLKGFNELTDLDFLQVVICISHK